MRAARKALGEEARAQASATICRRLTALPLLQTGAPVAVYLATPDEANIDALASTLIQRGDVVVAPVMGKCPAFTRLRDLENGVITDATGLRVPACNTDSEHVTASKLDVVILPGLAFDQSGARLGQGGGWYDRVLANASAVTAIGVCFDCQLLAAIPLESHDRRVSLVVTEKRIIKVQ